MRVQFLYILFVILVPSQMKSGFRSRLIIWDVGQGQWITYSNDGACLHFDMGGEYAPLLKINHLCNAKPNWLFLSHSDYDHTRFIKWAEKTLMSLCIHRIPRDFDRNQQVNHKQIQGNQKLSLNNIKKIRLCQANFLPKKVFEVPFVAAFATPNDLSRVYLLKTQHQNVLIPGDSTINAETSWGAKIESRVQTLILGHHGSKTSTGDSLLTRLPDLKQAIASARKKRYGHPHRTVITRLKSNGIATLSTDIWGSIEIQPD